MHHPNRAWPSCRPQCQHHRIWLRADFTVGCLQSQRAIVAKSEPAMAYTQPHPCFAQAVQPGAQQRCGLLLVGKRGRDVPTNVSMPRP